AAESDLSTVGVVMSIAPLSLVFIWLLSFLASFIAPVNYATSNHGWRSAYTLLYLWRMGLFLKPQSGA
ncbi:MAG: hypothetical protein P1R74_13935, partial [Sedimenticola sp.]|nr:hypothetical protein [Sedimenticola sp.]